MTKLTRREFVRNMAGASAGLALPRGFLQAAAAKRSAPSVVGGLTIGVQSFSFRAFTLEKMIEAMNDIGLTSLELWDGHLHPVKNTEADFRDARAKLDAAGIAVSAYCPNFGSGQSPEFFDRAFKGAGILGTSVMTTSTEKSVVPKLDEWAKRFNVTIGLHNHYLSDSWFKGDKKANFEGPADFDEALKTASPHIAINLDIGHFSAAGYDPVAFFKEHHARIVSLHVKDRDKDPLRSHRAFGKGATPITAVLKAAQEVKFKYASNIEWEEDEQNPVPGIRDSYAYIKKALA
jgi:sugar phosphate isomerase/epimerase